MEVFISASIRGPRSEVNYVLLYSVSVSKEMFVDHSYPRKRVPQRIGFQDSISMETCSATNWFPRLHLHGNVFRNELVSKTPSPRKRVSQRIGFQDSISMETCFPTRSLAMGLHVTLTLKYNLKSPSLKSKLLTMGLQIGGS
jgi:hypothetical protein